MSKTYRLPVIYVFGKKPLDVSDATEKLLESFASSNASAESVILTHDVAHTHEEENLISALRSVLANRDISVSFSPIPRALSPPTTSVSEGPMFESEDRIADVNSRPDSSENTTAILYVGAPSLRLTNLLLRHPTTPVHAYDPATREATLQSAKTNKLLMRRYALVQKARDADVFGILVGTLGIASYLPMIAHLRKVIARAHKKAYTISVGRLHPAKLANFAEIECFVLVACPENSLVDSKDFIRPIVTPFELQVALQPSPTWTGEYVLNLEEVLTRRPPEPSLEEDEEEDLDRPVFSLVTGRYRQAKRYGENDRTPVPTSSSSALILRDQDGTVTTLKDSAAGEFLQSRTFRGLEPRAGLDPPSVLQQGRSGIARGYGDDHRA